MEKIDCIKEWTDACLSTSVSDLFPSYGILLLLEIISLIIGSILLLLFFGTLILVVVSVFLLVLSDVFLICSKKISKFFVDYLIPKFEFIFVSVKVLIYLLVIFFKTVLFPIKILLTCLQKVIPTQKELFERISIWLKFSNKSENTEQAEAEKLIKYKCAICFEDYDIKEGFVTCLPGSENSDGNDNFTTDLPHILCISCIRGYAHSSITGSSVAFGGIGLKCVELECKNVFLLPSFELHIDEQDVTPLKQSLQQQCLLDAGIDDLVTCTSCDLKFSVSTDLKFFICECGRKQCRFCPRIYDDEHINKSCEEIDDSENNLNLMISETVIRKCYKCGIAFVKEKGCNKMECRCGAKQCYICREKDIDYKHFCRCFDPLEKHGKCPKCNKTCRIYEDAEELDEINIQKLKETANANLKKNNNFCVII